jgi:hypothetical protein
LAIKFGRAPAVGKKNPHQVASSLDYLRCQITAICWIFGKSRFFELSFRDFNI